MILSMISFTENGNLLAKRLEKEISDGTVSEISEVILGCKWSGAGDDRISCSLDEWTGQAMYQKHALLFIGACGIAVRAIAPYVKNKLYDSPVLVCDELGNYVIPILSGHMGGANELAVRIADVLDAIPVITTATDLNHKFAVDVFAKKNQLAVMNKEGIAKVSAKVLRGEKLTFSIEAYPPKCAVDVAVTSENRKIDAALVLKPKIYAVGMGCRKGKEPEKIAAWIGEVLKNEGIAEEQVFALASIDVKKEEAGLKAWAYGRKIPFYTYSAEELSDVPGVFEQSSFVEKQVGVGNVCERAAVRACGDDGKLILKKQAYDGMTIAVARKTWSVDVDEI